MTPHGLLGGGIRYSHRLSQEKGRRVEKWLSPFQSFFIIISMQKPSFEQFEATSLYCPRCKAAVPVRKRLLLVLPEGEEYEYLCAYCSFSVGTKIDKDAPQIDVIIKP
jgi:hypothetical protein